MLKTGHNFDGDSLSYLDMMERNNEEERRKETRKNRFEVYTKTKHIKVNKQIKKTVQ